MGRDDELAELIELVDPASSAGRVAVLLGDAGMGKTALVGAVTARAKRSGFRILTATGRESETSLAWASLHQLLRPVLGSGLDQLSEAHRDVLRALMGVAPSPVAVDRFMAGVSVLSLVSNLSNQSPLLVVVEDLHWVDPSSLDVILFLAHRLTEESSSLLLTVRPAELPARHYSDLRLLHLEPLRPREARKLLDDQANPPRGMLREQVLTHAAGNPMALIEFSRSLAADPSAIRRWAAAPLPVSDRISSVIAARLVELPAATRSALLSAAVSDGPQPSGMTVTEMDPDVLAPAESQGLIRVQPSGFLFTHPLVRSTIYHGATFAERAVAHRRIAEALSGEPDRRAWHLSAATIGTDDELAQLLEETAVEAQRREGTAAAVVAMERAAELSSDPESRARRYTSAALLAVLVGQLDLVVELANRALGLTSDPQLRITARETVGFALSLSPRLNEAVEVLLSVAYEAASRGMVYAAWDCLRNAAQAAYFSGTPAAQESVRQALRLVDRLDTARLDDRQTHDIRCFRLWVRSTIDPFTDRTELLQELDATAHVVESAHHNDSSEYEPRLGVDVASAEQAVAASAWILDETERAARMQRRIAERLARPQIRGTSPSVLGLLSVCLVNIGRWDDALDAAAQTEDLAIAYRVDIATAASHITCAQIHALRGNPQHARDYLDRAAALFDFDQASIMEVQVRRASALADVCDGAHEDALTQLNRIFDDGGRALHRYESYPGLADLADAFARCGRRAEGRARIDQILEKFCGEPSIRLNQVFMRAKAILADEKVAGELFRLALADERGMRWPLERLKLNLDYGEWLRRRRSINEAKVYLSRALRGATDLAATPLMLRARTELRACGVAVATSPERLSALTPQQLEIVRLAASGLTNRHIAERMYLSEKTVISHLYRSYPKLGVTARHELAGVLARAEASSGT